MQTIVTSNNYDLNSGNLWSIMAEMSQAAYGGNGTNRNDLIESQSWETIKFNSDLNGFYDSDSGRYEFSDFATAAGAFITRSGDTAVISFEGTDPSDWRDWTTDILGMFPALENLVPLIDAFDQFVATNGINKVYVTGHSLGGAFAQAYMMAHPNTNGISYEAITFAAPGFNFGTNPLAGYAFHRNIPTTSKMTQMPQTPLGLSHDSRVLHFEIDGDIVPDLLIKIGNTVHLHGEGMSPAEVIAFHLMGLYQKAIELIDQEITGEKNFAPGSNVLFDALYSGSEFFVGISDAILIDNDLVNAYEYIIGGTGDDSLGGRGANRMYGGTGSDTYYINNDGDEIHESSALDGGSDSVWSSLKNYKLPDFVENLFLLPNKSGISIDDALNGEGNELNNTIEGNDGSNVLEGKGGDDILIGGLGHNTLVGGNGFDMADYSQIGHPVILDLGKGAIGEAFSIGINDYYDTLVDIEGAIGTEYDDSFTGDSLDNFFELVGGNDYVDGKSGNDWVSYGRWNSGVTIDLKSEFQSNNNGRLISIENLWGSPHDDWLYGSIANNHLQGGNGVDHLFGERGSDHLYGGEGDDFLNGGTELDTYHIDRFGDGVDTISDEGGLGLILLGGVPIMGNASPVGGRTGNKQLYELENNDIKLEYDITSKTLNIYEWNGKLVTDKIFIKDFESGHLHIHLAAATTTPIPDPEPDPTPTPTPDPVPSPVSVPNPSTDGSSNSLLSVQAVNQTIDVKTKIPLIRLFPLDQWVDNDGLFDIVSFAVADRTPGGGFLEVSGVQAQAGKVYEFPFSDITNWYFVGGTAASVDEIGFNIIQTNGDYSPRLEPGAIVTTVKPTEPAPDPDPTPETGPSPTGGGSNLAALSFASTSTGASSGGEIEVIYKVKNIGDERSAKGRADIVLADDPDLQLGRRLGDDFSIPELNPGEERTYTRTIDVPHSGNGNFYLGIDVRSVSLGHNLIETDDTASIPFKIGAGLSGDPDLNPGLADPKKIFSQGLAETIDFSISTNANGSPQYDYRVLLSRDDVASSDDVVLIDKKSSGGLGYIGTHYYKDTQITIPDYISDGLYHLIVVADPFNKISETKENNNSADRQIVVASRAADSNDLSNIVGSHVVVESDIMHVMQPYKFESYGFMDSIDDPVDASEDGPLIPFKDKLYLSEDNIFDKYDIPIRSGSELIQQPLGQIIRDGITFSLPQWIDSGDYYLFAAFDTDNEITEDIESDNVTKGTNVTIINNVTRTVSAGDDAIDLFEGDALTLNILSNDTSTVNQEMAVMRFEGDFVNSSAPFVGQAQSGLSYSISRDGTLSLDASALNFDIQAGGVRTETFRYELISTADDTADLGVVTVSIRDPAFDTIQVIPNNAAVKETDGTIEFTITRSGDRLTSAETLYVSTIDEYGRINRNDYTSLQKQPLVFEIGESTKIIPVNILPDDVTEFDETFGLIVQTESNAPTSRFFTATTFTIQDSTTVTGIKKVGNEIPFNATAQNDQLNPEVAALKNGYFVISWADVGNDSVKAQLFAIDGSKLGGEIIVDPSTQMGGWGYPKIGALPDGGFVIVWQDVEDAAGVSGRAIKAQVFTDDGSKVGSEILVNTAIQNSPFNPQIITLQNGGFAITWSDFSQGNGGASGDSSDTAVKAQVFDVDGNKVGTEILVNTVTQGYQDGQQISALSNGGFVVAWVDESQGVDGTSGNPDRDIKAQVFADDGSKVGVEILVNTAIQGSQEGAQITSLPGGGFVIIWNDFGQGIEGAAGDSDSAIKAQVFTDDGSKVGNEILVNSAILNGQHDAMVIGLSDGGFVITWSDYSHGNGGASGDSTGTAVKSQVFGADGSKVGAEILVNTATQNDQIYPQISALPHGGFVVAWLDESQGAGGAGGDSSGRAIKAQAFASDGSKIGNEILVNTAIQNDQKNPRIAVLPDGSFAIAWEDDGDVVEARDLFSLLGYSIKAQVFKTTGGLTTNPNGDSIVIVDGSKENIVLTDSKNLVLGAPDTLDGINIENFETGDTLFISGVELEQNDLSVTKGSAILSLDTDKDGQSDTVITLAGDFRLESFIVAGASSSGSYILYLGNSIPIGNDDNSTVLTEGFSTDEDHIFTTANVLANDSDADGDALSITAFDTTGTLGLVTDNGDGTFHYDPNGMFDYLNAGESATDSFTYTVSDGNGGNDTATVTITINGIDDAPVLNPIAGTGASDYLVGTDAADIIHSLGGSYDRSAGGLGADIFVFGSEALNGVRERDVILDYEVGVDAIMLTDGATVGSIRQTSTGAVIFLGGDLDAIYVQGEGVLTGNLTFVPENILFA